MRKSIEALALWYIPVWVLMVIFSGYYMDYFQDLVGSDSSSHVLAFSVFLSRLIGTADHFVVAIWLISQTHQDARRKVIWFIFGVATGLIGAIIYLLVRAYEEKNAFNNQIKRDLGADAPRPLI